MDRKISLVAEHIPGLQNQAADQKSRKQPDRWDWKLNPMIFNRLNQIWGCLTLNLFATRNTTQLDKFFSWKLDLQAEGTDAFLQQWEELAFANPQWLLIPRTLSEVRIQRATIILVALVWKSQAWYPVLLSLLFDHPRSIPPQASNVIQTDQIPPPIRGQDIQLATWPISGDPTKLARYQRMLQDWLWLPGIQSHNPPTLTFSEVGALVYSTG
uniref:Uncharacterized protein n=1 Tax=Amphimedon queenslandica TaxID=400682 RepID=A0A1X7UJP0_AMPQE